MAQNIQAPSIVRDVAALMKTSHRAAGAIAASQVLVPAKDRLVIATNGQPATWQLSALPSVADLGSSLNLSLNGQELDEATDYSVDYTTGIVTFSSGQQALFKVTPAPADVLTADYLTSDDGIANTQPVDLGAISDGFTGPSNQHLSGRVTSDGRANWVVPLGDFLTNNPGVESVAFQSIGYIETSATDGTVQCDITPDTLAAYYAVMVRYVDNNNYWYFEAKNAANTGRVVHNTAGSPNVIASSLAVGGAGPFTMKVVMVGTSLQFYNGATLLYTDTGGALSTATKHGIWAGNNGVGNLFANWSWTP